VRSFVNIFGFSSSLIQVSFHVSASRQHTSVESTPSHHSASRQLITPHPMAEQSSASYHVIAMQYTARRHITPPQHRSPHITTNLGVRTSHLEPHHTNPRRHLITTQTRAILGITTQHITPRHCGSRLGVTPVHGITKQITTRRLPPGTYSGLGHRLSLRHSHVYRHTRIVSRGHPGSRICPALGA